MRAKMFVLLISSVSGIYIVVDDKLLCILADKDNQELDCDPIKTANDDNNMSCLTQKKSCQLVSLDALIVTGGIARR